MANANCRYCGKETHHPQAQVCRSVQCQKRRCLENAQRSNANKRARIARGEKVYVRPKEPQQAKPRMKEVICLRCDSPFKVRLDMDGVPLYRQCENCRKFCREYLSYVGAWE